jgi:hypothetical protein
MYALIPWAVMMSTGMHAMSHQKRSSDRAGKAVSSAVTEINDSECIK